jgi:hypothetical protein
MKSLSAPGLDPSFSRKEIYWKAALWAALLTSLFFCILGAAVNVPWGNTAIPLWEAIGTINIGKAAPELAAARNFQALVAGAVCAAVFTCAASRTVRLIALFLGIVVHASLTGLAAVVGMFFAPLLAVFFLINGGAADGEFYIEEMPQLAAAGLWMLAYVVLLLREFWMIVKEERAAESRMAEAALKSI